MSATNNRRGKRAILKSGPKRLSEMIEQEKVKELQAVKKAGFLSRLRFLFRQNPTPSEVARVRLESVLAKHKLQSVTPVVSRKSTLFSDVLNRLIQRWHTFQVVKKVKQKLKGS